MAEARAGWTMLALFISPSILYQTQWTPCPLWCPASVLFPRLTQPSPPQVPTLEEAVELLLSLDVRIILDVKIPHPDFVPALLALFAKQPRYPSARFWVSRI